MRPKDWKFSEVVAYLMGIGTGIEDYHRKIARGGLLNHAAKAQLRNRFGMTAHTADDIILKFTGGKQND